MFIPSLTRFELNTNINRYEKRVIIRNIVYTISISKDNWNRNMSNSVSKWIKTHTNMGCTFPYGYIKKEDSINVNDVKENGCEFCGKIYSTFKNKRRHMKSCKHKDNIPEKPPEETSITTLENTIIPHQTIINNNNNNITIHNNIQICDFGNEKQEWLTKELLNSVFLDRKLAVKQLIRNRHFNSNFPENQNIRIDNKNNINKRLQVFSKGKWRVRETKPVIDLAFINTHEIISDLLNVDEAPFDDDYQSRVIKEFQGTDRFQSMYSRLLRKWEDFGSCLKEENPEFQEYWEYIKTLLLDKKLLLDQSK